MTEMFSVYRMISLVLWSIYLYRKSLKQKYNDFTYDFQVLWPLTVTMKFKTEMLSIVSQIASLKFRLVSVLKIVMKTLRFHKKQK